MFSHVNFGDLPFSFCNCVCIGALARLPTYDTVCLDAGFGQCLSSVHKHNLVAGTFADGICPAGLATGDIVPYADHVSSRWGYVSVGVKHCRVDSGNIINRCNTSRIYQFTIMDGNFDVRWFGNSSRHCQ